MICKGDKKMIQNNRINEKLQTHMPENETQRLHVLVSLTEKINLIESELVAFAQNIIVAEDHVRVLKERIATREQNLELLKQRKKEIENHSFVPEPTKDMKYDELEEKLQEKGHSIDEILASLKGKKTEEQG